MTAAREIDEDGAAPALTAKGSGTRFGKRAIILAVAAVVLLAFGGGAAAYFLRQPEAKAAEGEHAPEAEVAYVELPALIVNLRSADGAPRLIKLRVMLVPAAASDVPAITARMPLVVDSFQPFLRELRPEDLAGAAAVFRIKEELLIRANEVAGAGKVKNVLIQDLIQQ